MDVTGGMRATAVAAALVMLGGLSVLLHGVTYSDVARAIGGGCLSIVALMAVSMILLRRWITDTSNERRALADAQSRAALEYDRYVAAQAALELERGRLRRDVDAERAQIAAQLKAERAAMDRDFEEQKATVIAQTMEATVLMFHNGKFAPDQPAARTNLIQFPKQAADQSPATGQAPEGQRERSREHGVVGP
jgi:hypothetical protein